VYFNLSAIIMQKYIEARGGDRSIYRVCYTHGIGAKPRIDSITRHAEFLSSERHLMRSEFIPISSFNDVVNGALEAIVRRAITHIERRMASEITKAAFDLVVDPTNVVHFLWSQEVFMTGGYKTLTSDIITGDAFAATTSSTMSLSLEQTKAVKEQLQEDFKALMVQPVGSGTKGRILIVDADAAAVVEAARILAQEGFVVTVVDDGPRALSLTRVHHFDCVLLGRDLPTLSGLEVARILRQRESHAAGRGGGDAGGVPIIAFTDKTDEKDIGLYHEAGMNGCISKPVIPDALLRTIEASIPTEGQVQAARTLSATSAVTMSQPGSPTGLVKPMFEAVPAGLIQSPITSPTGGKHVDFSGRSGLPPISKTQTMAQTVANLDNKLKTLKAQHGESPYAQNLLGDHLKNTVTKQSKDQHARAVADEAAPNNTSLVGMTASGNARAVTGGVHGGRVYHGAMGAGASAMPGAASGQEQVATVQGDSVVGVYQFDAETSIPYCIVGEKRPGLAIFHLIVVHDIFDTYEAMQIFFRKVTDKWKGLQVLLFNIPGQAYTTFRKDVVLNNEYQAGVMQGLMSYLSAQGNGLFDLDNGAAPFHLIGYGNGAAIASCFVWKYLDLYPTMRSLVLVNGFTHVDAHLAGVFHDCVNVFSCTPPTRPDLPIYFFSRFLFSAPYLQKVGAPLALNMYTAVTNPISLDGRIALCQGAMSHVSTYAALSEMPIPLVLVSSIRDTFVKPSHTAAIVKARGGEVRSVKRALVLGKGAAVIKVSAGHECFQECRLTMQTLFSQLVSGYHERNDVAYPVLDDTAKAARAAALENSATIDDKGKPSQQRASKLASFAPGAAIEEARRANPWPGQRVTPELQAKMVAAGSTAMLEDRFLDHVVQSMRNDDTLSAYPASAEEIRLHRNQTHLEGLPLGLGIGDTVVGTSLDEDFNNMQAGADDGTAEHHGFSSSAPLTSKQQLRQQLGSLPPLRRMNRDDVAMVTSKLARSAAGLDLSGERREANTLPFRVGPKVLEKQQADEQGEKLMQKILPQTDAQEYMNWRMKRNQRRLQRIEAAARTIQKAFRSFVARTAVKRIRRHKAALDIQRWWRGELSRAFVGALLRFHRASKDIQRVYRGFRARMRVRRMRAELEAAIDIQRVYRGHVARVFVAALRRTLNAAALVIQCAWRRFAAIKELIRRRIERVAAITVQRIARGFLARKRATRERDRYLFSKSQAQGIELGRQLLMEHKLHATRLQSEVSILTKEKVATEEQIQALLTEIGSFEQGVRLLEKEMMQLSRADAEVAMVLDETGKTELREHKLRLDREFSSMLARINDRREQLAALQAKLQSLDRARASKREDLKDLEKKLVVLLEHQQGELHAIRRRQELRGERLIEDAVEAVTHAMTNGEPLPALTAGFNETSRRGGASGRYGDQQLMLANEASLSDPLASAVAGRSITQRKLLANGEAGSTIDFNDLQSVGGQGRGGGGGNGGPTPQQRAEAAALMSSTETMMKFGFMAMSLTYFSSMNMVKAMRQVGTANTIMANNPVMAMIGSMGTAALNGNATMANALTNGTMAQGGMAQTQGTMALTQGMGATSGGDQFSGVLQPGKLPGQEVVNPRLWTVADVGRWLESLHLSQYRDAFADSSVDGDFLLVLTEEDLRATLGIEHTLHRKKILNSIYRLQRKEQEMDEASKFSNSVAAAATIASMSVTSPLKDKYSTPARGSRVAPHGSVDSDFGSSLSASYQPDSLVGGGNVQQSPSVRNAAKRTLPDLQLSTPGGFAPAAPDTMISPPRLDASHSTANNQPSFVIPPRSLELGEVEKAETNAFKRAEARNAGLLKIDELLSWVRHNKLKPLVDAFETLPDQQFRASTLKSAYEPGVGSVYTGVHPSAFHMNKTDEKGNTLLVVAAQNGRMKIAQLLMKKGANPNHQNALGNTALHYAMAFKFHELGAWLVDPEGGCASDDVMNQAGLGPYDGLEP
jgi:CheY-like chemotaxis protein/pimeloyl-ACP methyl ester carboxylesterase